MSITPDQPQPVASGRRWRRRIPRLLGWTGLAYLGVLIVMLALENLMLYHPTRYTESWEAPADARVQDVNLRSADGTPIHAWWCPRDDADGVVLYCHGNAGNLSHRSGTIACWQKEMNLSVLIFDYPGYGRSGGKPSEAGCYAAADAAYDWLVNDRKVSPDRLSIFGASLGGGVAVDLAARRPHRAVILSSTFTSIPDMAQKLFPWLPARWFVRNRFDNLGKIGRCKGLVFIAHGDCDGLVPFSQGERLFRAANDPKEFYPMRGCDHDQEPDGRFFKTLTRFLAEAPRRAGEKEVAAGPTPPFPHGGS